MINKAVLVVKGQKILHVSNHYVHLTYLVLVSIESHGLYGIAAGVLGVIVAVDGIVEHLNKRANRHE